MKTGGSFLVEIAYKPEPAVLCFRTDQEAPNSLLAGVISQNWWL
jgi:hypothetical protein